MRDKGAKNFLAVSVLQLYTHQSILFLQHIHLSLIQQSLIHLKENPIMSIYRWSSKWRCPKPFQVFIAHIVFLQDIIPLVYSIRESPLTLQRDDYPEERFLSSRMWHIYFWMCTFSLLYLNKSCSHSCTLSASNSFLMWRHDLEKNPN